MKYLKLRDFAFLALMVGFAFAMGGCTPPPTPEPNDPNNGVINPSDPDFHRILVSNEAFVLGPADTTVKVIVMADCDWAVEGLNYWCRTNPTEAGEGDTVMEISVTANNDGEERTATLTFDGDAQIKKSITITQRSYKDVTAMQTYFEVENTGGTFSTEIISDVEWKVVGAPDWITLQPTQGDKGESVLTIEVAPNESILSRSAEFYFEGEFDTADTLRVVQEGTFVFGSNAADVHSSPIQGDTLTVEVLSNVDYTIASSEPWIRLSATEGKADKNTTSFQVFVGKNYTEAREGFVSVSAVGVDSVLTVKIQQEGTISATGNSIVRFRFLRTVNPSLPKDVELTIAGDSIVGTVPSLDVDVTSLIPTFSVSNSAQVYVGNMRQMSGKTKQNFTKRVKYTVVAENGNEREYTIALHRFTGLPILYINTNSGAEIASKDFWEGATYRLDGGLNYESIPETTLQVKGRGNSSWSTFLKKRSYNMKFEERTEVCGMPKHKRWCLISNYRDKTLLRNQVAMELGRVTQLEWVPRGVQVELVKNGTHRGTYLLSEQIRIDENRVNIQELHKDDVQSEAITGGYVLEVDRYGDSDTYSFYSKYMTGTIYEADSKSLVHVKIPSIEDGNDAQFKYIESHFRKAEEAICNNKGDWTEALSTYIDLSSIIDQWLIYEITATPEPARGPYSFYMYKKQGDTKFYGGPLWDFDFMSFIRTTQNQWVNKTAGWIPFLWDCPEFRATVKAHWDMYKADFYDIQSRYIDEQERYLRKSAEANWAIHHQNLIDDGRRENGDET
ncbi:MAG: CotH kinase family protein, partial [Rikenellaceae bacterium]|nr:CotH kinase family protein [Rikenellaceae bacterium]